MNDQFIKDYRKEPRNEAIRTLQDRFIFIEGNKTSFMKRPVTIGVYVLVLALILTPVISPPVRGHLGDWIRQIGGIFIKETDNYPGDDGPLQTLPDNQLSLENARAQLPFTIDLPTWIPQGFNLRTNVKITHFQDVSSTVYIDWDTPSQSIFSLIIQQRIDGDSGRFIIGAGGSEELQINGHPAVLFRGAWNADTNLWDSKLGLLTLSWQRKDLTYTLQGLDTDISVGDLIRVAESIP